MTDTQLLTLAIAVIVPLNLLIYSNSRISDAKDANRASITEAKETLRADLRAIQAGDLATIRAELGQITATLATIQADLKEFFKILAEHGKRISRLEDKP